MPELASHIASVFRDTNCELWFPQLTAHLTSNEWKRLITKVGIVPQTYSTARVVTQNVSVPREIISTLDFSFRPKTIGIAIEESEQQWADFYSNAGVRFYSRHEIEKNASLLLCVSDALKLISRIPSLIRTVQTLVRSIHIMKQPDADHDVSFSEPHIPFSIFISVFEERIPSDVLRVAEAIVHEAMHLQLTMIENVVPLVNRKDSRYHSPWRQEYRDAQSLLHGLYVFSVITEFLGKIAISSSVDSDYVSNRIQNIAGEINQTRAFSQCSELTFGGSQLVKRLLPN